MPPINKSSQKRHETNSDSYIVYLTKKNLIIMKKPILIKSYIPINVPTQQCWILTISTHICTKPGLSINFVLQTEVNPAKGNYSEHLENWKKGIEDAFATAMKTQL